MFQKPRTRPLTERRSALHVHWFRFWRIDVAPYAEGMSLYRCRCGEVREAL
jgi:hypothetical protein